MAEEHDRTFYERRRSEELAKAGAATQPELKQLHTSWARLYEGRLAGTRISMTDAVREAVRLID